MSRGTFLPEIQGMRAIAVLLVLIYHSGLGAFSGGYIGVDVFFVISGYLITGLLLKEIRSTGSVDIPAFYSRRIRRLLPAAGLVLVVTLLIATQLYAPLDIKQLTSSAFSTALYFSNLWFAHLSTDYLADDTATNPFLHTWSLSVEEQFYLIWPILILLAVRLFRHRDAARAILPVLLLLVVTSLAAAIYLTQQNQPWAFFGSPTRAWEFGLGALLALLPRQDSGRVGPWLSGLSLAGLVAILYAALTYDRHTPFPGTAALLPTLGAAGMIAAIHYRRATVVHRLLNNGLFQYLGNISYSLYLWHWPVFVFLPHMSDKLGPTERVAGLCVSLALAALSYRYVENPVRSGTFVSFSRSKGAFALGLLITFSTTVSALTIRQMTISSLQSETQSRYLQASHDLPILYNRSLHGGCHAQQHETDIPDCVFANPASSKTIILFGDSHAAHWFPALQQLATDRGLRFVSLTKTGCPSVVFEPFHSRLTRQYTECTHWRDNAFRRIQQEKPLLLILANSKRYIHSASKTQRWNDGLQATLKSIATASTQIVLINDTPSPGFHVPRCLSKADWNGQDPDKTCRYAYDDAVSNLLEAIERKQLQSIPNGNWIDMNRFICSGNNCGVQQGGNILFQDGHHLTASYSRSLSAALLQSLQRHGTPLL